MIDSVTARACRVPGEAPLAEALLELLTSAQAAVASDCHIARRYLARATALLLADLESGAVRHATGSARRGALPRWQSNRLVTHIQENLSGKISSADLIPLTGLSSGHFFRSFRATFGESPCSYIARRRIERAQKMMLTTTEPLCRIALDCGLCDQSHLTRLFRRVVGTTPNAWRREYGLEMGHQNR